MLTTMTRKEKLQALEKTKSKDYPNTNLTEKEIKRIIKFNC